MDTLKDHSRLLMILLITPELEIARGRQLVRAGTNLPVGEGVLIAMSELN